MAKSTNSAVAKSNKKAAAVNRLAEADFDAPADMQIEILVFRVTGITGLLQNNPIEFIGKTGEDTLAVKKTYIDEEEAAKRVYKTEDGLFYHPAEAFTKSMVKASTGRKFGKKSAPGLLKGVVFIAETACILEDENGKPLKQYELDRRSVVNPANKARVLRCRPLWPKWTTRVALEVDTAILTASHVLQALQLAGRTVGVGDFRPEKGGSFGRFKAELE